MHTYRCLLTVPGIGPRTASELVIGVDIAEFDGCFSFLSRDGSYTNIGDIIASPAYSLFRAFGKEARFICKLLEAPLYYCISLAEIERKIVLRALKEMGEDVVMSDDLLQVENDWAHLQEARKNSALPGPIPLYPWIIAREANVLSKTISVHQTFLLNNIRPSYPGNALLSQSYLTNLEYCAAQWTEIKKRMTRLTNLIMLF